MTASEASASRCQYCVLPENYPGLRLDDEMICQFCRDVIDEGGAEARLSDMQSRIDEAVAAAGVQDTAYQCIVAYSGGKDSTYTLKRLVEQYGLRCLAVTVDNGFLSDVTLENCRRVSDALGADHILFRPTFGFMQRMYSESLKGGVHTPASIARASDVCNSCINLINSYMIRVAMQNHVGLIAGGYLGGQVPKDSAVLHLDLEFLRRARGATKQRYQERFGIGASRYFALPPKNSDQSGKLTIINPMLVVEYSEDDIIADISSLGWTRPSDTGGFSSNCRLNDVGILGHIKRHGFHPYVAEMAELVRNGFVSREAALQKLQRLPDPDTLTDVVSKLGIELSDI